MTKADIMIVEDSRIVAEDIKQKLSDLNYNVCAVATSGYKALAAAAEKIPDLVLMDIKLGDGMNGIDTAAELRRKYQIPIIYLTAYADENTVSRAKVTEPFGYIVKPFDDKELQSAIEIALYKHQMERKLRESEQWLYTTLSSIGDGVIATDQTGCVAFMNPVAEALTGWPQNEAIGRPLHEVFQIVNELTREPVENPVDKVLATGGIVGLANHTVLINRQGGEIPVKDSGAPIRLQDGNTLGVILVFQNDSEPRKAAQELEKQRQLFQTIIDNIPVLITMYDPNTKMLLVNRAFEETVGWTRDEVRHIDIMEECYPDPAYRALANDYMKKAAKDWHEFKVTTKYGTIVDTIWSNVRIDNGTQIGIGIDITEKKKLETQLQQSQKMESVGTLAGGIAHDFNNILASVMGFSELAMVDAPPDSSQRENLVEVLTAAKRARDLVQQILTFARQKETDKKPIQPKLVFREAARFLRSTIPTTIQIKEDISSEGFIFADSTQFYQVIINLGTNAAQAMEDDGGVLTLLLEDIEIGSNPMPAYPGLKPGAYVRLTVKDTGNGMSPDVIDSIFEPYYTTRQQGGGTGLGLAVVYGIVKDAKGHIEVNSEPGRGAVFEVLWPRIRISQEPDRPAKGDLPTGNERILFVDDETSIARMAAQILMRLEYRVTVETDPIKALELVRKNPEDFDLVMTDMTMPGMTGDRLAGELLNIRPDLPIILCTGFSRKVSEEKTAAIGVKALAMKPLNMDRLATIVRTVLDEAKPK